VPGDPELGIAEVLVADDPVVLGVDHQHRGQLFHLVPLRVRLTVHLSLPSPALTVRVKTVGTK